MKKRRSLSYSGLFKRLVFLFTVFSFCSCAVSLSPKSDQGIVDNLSSTSVELFQFFAEVSAGTTAADFTKREPKYNSLIGKTEALELQIKARPMPKNKTLEKVIDRANERLKKRGVATPISLNDAPSATSLEQIVRNLEQMKTSDKSNGLPPATVTLFKGFVQLYLDQALTYERFLNK